MGGKLKIVINACFGGFSLSHKANMRYAELSGFKLYPYLDNITVNVYGKDAIIGNEKLLHHYSKVPLDTLETITDNFGERYIHSNDNYFSCRDIKRDDPILIQVIEELGKDADGSHAKLKIVEIPDDINWIIEEYDGFEHIAESHRTWS